MWAGTCTTHKTHGTLIGQIKDITLGPEDCYIKFKSVQIVPEFNIVQEIRTGSGDQAYSTAHYRTARVLPPQHLFPLPRYML